jgi:hypothetical protein
MLGAWFAGDHDAKQTKTALPRDRRRIASSTCAAMTTCRVVDMIFADRPICARRRSAA